MFDNTRPAVALEKGISRVTARVHQPGDTLPEGFVQERELAQKAAKLKLPEPKTWGDALRARTNPIGFPRKATEVLPTLKDGAAREK